MIGILLLSGVALAAHSRQKRLAGTKLFKKDKPQPQATAWHTQRIGTPTIIAGEPGGFNAPHRGKV